MLFVPKSSTYLIRLLRSPVRIDEMAMTVITPMTMPRTVRKLLNLCARTLSSAITRVSFDTNDTFFKSTPSVLSQRDDWVELRGLIGRVDSEHHSDAARHHKRKHNVAGRDRHRDGGRVADDP